MPAFRSQQHDSLPGLRPDRIAFLLLMWLGLMIWVPAASAIVRETGGATSTGHSCACGPKCKGKCCCARGTDSSADQQPDAMALESRFGKLPNQVDCQMAPTRHSPAPLRQNETEIREIKGQEQALCALIAKADQNAHATRFLTDDLMLFTTPFEAPPDPPPDYSICC